MDNDFSTFFNKLSAKQKEMLSKSQTPKTNNKLQIININAAPAKAQKLAPLVEKIQPVSVVGRKNSVTNTPLLEKKIIFCEEKQAIMDDTLSIEGFNDFYNLLKNTQITENERIKKFIEFVESIPKACGCVRGALNETAQSMYSQMLPLLQVELPDFFDEIKKQKNIKKIVCKDKSLVIFEI